MHDFTSSVVISIGLLAAGASADELDHTLDFRNDTASRVQQTVAEDAGNNLKEVEYGDFDNDGDPDVAMAVAGGVFGDRVNKLYRNDDGVFVEVSGAPVIAGFGVADLSRTAHLRDYDGDGWLDLIIVNDSLSSDPVLLYVNQHPGEVFAGFVEEGAAHGLGLEASCGATVADFDGDGDDDLYVGNYPGPSQDTLLLNNAGIFVVVTPTHVPDDGDYTIDIASADINGDGTLDMLVSNFSPNYIYYNNNLGQADQGTGDFKYGAGGNAGRQNLGSGDDSAMEPGDFNDDGRVDIYWTNRSGTTGDRILVNTGNNAGGMAVFNEQVPSPYAAATISNKASVGDLNGDGRLDVVVMTEGRPAILRNTSVNGDISFVDWTPASAFPSGTGHNGEHAAIFDTGGDGDPDILVGANHDDHLFETVNSAVVFGDDLNKDGQLPDLYDGAPVAVSDHLGAGATGSYRVDTATANNGLLSIVLNGRDDLLLELRDQNNFTVMSSDRDGLGVEEALEANGLSGTWYTVRVTVLQQAQAPEDLSPTGGDGVINAADLAVLLGAWGDCPKPCPADLNGDDVVNATDLAILLGAWGPVENPFVLEVLGRDP